MKFYLNYIFNNLAATAKIMLGNTQGLNEGDHSATGFWLSFFALGLAMPFTVASKRLELETIMKSADADRSLSLYSTLATQEVASILAYIFSLVVFYAMTRSTGNASRFPRSVVAMNWGSLVLTILIFPLVVMMGQIANDNAVLPILGLILMVVFTFAMFNIVRLTLQIPPKPAILYVFVLSVFEIIAYLVLLSII